MSAHGASNPLTIHTAGPADADIVAALHADSWRHAYREILPDAYLDGEVGAERYRHWTKALAAPYGGFVLVASESGIALGFIAVTSGSEPGYDAVIDSLHVAAPRRGAGLGRLLMGRAAARLMADGAKSACLRVYDANAAAVSFYRRLGGQPDGHGIDPFAGADRPDTRFGWQDLAVLHAACARDG